MSMAAEELRSRIQRCLDRDSLLAKILPLGTVLEHAKLSRGLLLIKLAEGNGIDESLALDAAVGIELVHMATLVHDDVIDVADLRRGERSIRNQFGDKGAILYGDYLFSTAVHQIQITQREGCARLFTNCIQDTCKGESIQDLYLTRANSELSVDLLHEVARGKTGALFSFCTAAPLLMNRKTSLVAQSSAREIGYLSGLAYQLADDILDITGEAGNLGKPACNDFIKDCMTTPLFLFMSELELTWSDFRERYMCALPDLVRDFLQSKSFISIQQQVHDIKSVMESHLLNLEEEGLEYRKIIGKFWDHYIFNRMSQLRDAAMS